MRPSEELRAVLGAAVYSVDGRNLEAVVGDLLREKRFTIAVAESCTGGLLTSRLTDVPGSSAYVERSFVCYSNRSKVELLGVTEALLAEHGAVSEPVAQAMAVGARTRAGTDVGIGITGIAGPDGGTPDKPVGTVAIAVDVRRRDSRPHVSIHRRTRTGEVPGFAGGAEHAAAHAGEQRSTRNPLNTRRQSISASSAVSASIVVTEKSLRLFVAIDLDDDRAPGNCTDATAYG